jgi:ribosomal protein L7/L12
MAELAASICPNCGAPLQQLVNGACPFCKTTLHDARSTGHGWAGDAPGATVWLHASDRKVLIQVVKVVRHHTGLGLREAKALVDAANDGQPVAVATGVTINAAEGFAAALQTAGAPAEAAAIGLPDRQTGSSVWLSGTGPDRIAVIKVIRHHTRIDLAPAKQFTDAAEDGRPVAVATDLPADVADAFVQALLQAGASAQIG